MATLVNVNGVSKRFGGILALDEVSLAVQEGEIYGLIGPNGAGKTTLFNCMTGLYSVSRGEILLNGKPIHKPHVIGSTRSLRNSRRFANLTALENVLVNRHLRGRAGVFGAVLRDAGTRAEERDNRERARALLDFVGLANKGRTLAGHLACGEQRRLEIARARHRAATYGAR